MAPNLTSLACSTPTTSQSDKPDKIVFDPSTLDLDALRGLERLKKEHPLYAELLCCTHRTPAEAEKCVTDVEERYQRLSRKPVDFRQELYSVTLWKDIHGDLVKRLPEALVADEHLIPAEFTDDYWRLKHKEDFCPPARTLYTLDLLKIAHALAHQGPGCKRFEELIKAKLAREEELANARAAHKIAEEQRKYEADRNKILTDLRISKK